MWKPILTILLLAMTVLSVTAQGGERAVDERFEGQIAAPEFPTDLDWLNVENPLTLEGLRGKIVLFDFWTYGCINCIHMVPVLEQLEEKYADEVVVIGVHSAKFENEGETENIRQIVQRYDLHHPVINDKDFLVWRSYGVQAWPTFTILDPRGNVVAVQPGEVPFEAFDQYLTALIAYWDDVDENEINREPLETVLESAGNPGTPLLYPGKVLVDEDGERLFIADSNHHRIVVTDLETYEVLQVIGSGQRGHDNGTADQATFDKPQGMELVGSTLYVADVNNHVIRAVDLEANEVSTVAGTGKRAIGAIEPNRVIWIPDGIDLRSPWDVELGDDNLLHIAMAGSHQLWALDLDQNTISATVGNSRESALNATLATSELAQPSGLHYVDGLLYFADSESSTIRVADFNTDEVRTIAGTDQNNLFDFGDIDGELGESRLQHALGVTAAPDGMIYIADTYNSRIKQIDPETNTVTTIFGLGDDGGYRDGGADLAEFDEPGGLDYVDGKLYVADTNNHAIRIIDLEAGTVETIAFPNPEALVIDPEAVTVLGGNSSMDEVVALELQNVAAGDGEITLVLELPDGFKINELIDSTLTIDGNEDVATIDPLNHVISEKTLSIPVTFESGEGDVNLAMTLFYCRDTEDSLCFINETSFQVPISITDDGESSIQIDYEVTPPTVE